MKALWIVLACAAQDHELRWRLEKGDSWVEHRKVEYVTTEGKTERRQVLETVIRFSVQSEGRVDRTVRSFALRIESPEGKIDIAYENGAWKRTDWGDLEEAKEDYEEFVTHPPKLIAKANGEMRSVDEVEGEIVGMSPQAPALLPEGKVKVGDSWTVPEESEGLTEFLISMKLESVQGRTAILRMTMTLPERVESQADEATVQGSMPVSVEFDLDKGLIRSQKGSGEFFFTRRNPAGGAPIRSSLKMTVDTTREREK